MRKIIICLSVFIMPLSNVQAANKACSGKKGGISHCQGEKFVCKDGSLSKSKRTCPAKTYGTKPAKK
jgi:hypothetical protein